MGLGPATASHAVSDAGPVATAEQPQQHETFQIRPAGAVDGVRLDASIQSELGVEWEQQINGYYCGPAATRMALKAKHDSPPNQNDLAAMMGTDQAGTDHIGLVADALDSVLGTGTDYVPKLLDYSPTPEQKEMFRADVKADVDTGYAVVANIWVVAGGPRPAGYPSGDVFHYVTVIGYSDDGSEVLVADPAAGIGGFENVPSKYWIDADKMATLIGGKGYAA